MASLYPPWPDLTCLCYPIVPKMLTSVLSSNSLVRTPVSSSPPKSQINWWVILFFWGYVGSALLDTGVGQTLIHQQFVTKFNLPTNPLQVKHVVLADNRRIAINLKPIPFSVVFENLHSTLQGPILDLPSYNVILGLDWLKRNNPRVNWPTSTLTIKQEGMNHQTYPDTVDNLLKDYIFVRIKDTEDEQELKLIKWDTY